MPYDAQSGLYHTWFRQYDPNQGRWMGVDPLAGSLANPQSLNRYAYVQNDPVNLVDPLGLACGYVSASGWPDPFCETGSSAAEDHQALFCSSFEDENEHVHTVCSLVGILGDPRYPGNGPSTREKRELSDKKVKIGAAPPPKTVVPCRIQDPLLGAVEATVKGGPEIQLGPTKVGASLYKNQTTGDTGFVVEINAAGVVSAQLDNPTPPGGSITGTTEGSQFKISILGFQYNFTTREFKFAPSKSFSLGVQALVGVDFSFNSDTFNQISEENDTCRARGRN